MIEQKLEQRLERLRNEIKSLKAGMPIAGSLLDTYFYTSVFTHNYNDNDEARYTVKFTPVSPDDGIGLTAMYTYCEALAQDAYWSQYNPVYLAIDEGYQVNSSGQAIKSDRFIASGYGTYTVKITVSVYSSVPGTLSIEWT